jgi:hypothetical protein
MMEVHNLVQEELQNEYEEKFKTYYYIITISIILKNKLTVLLVLSILNK